MYPSQIGILDLVGYTVTSGKFTVGSETMLAVGAPRAKRLLGSVIILRKPTYGFNTNSVFDVLVGDQLGAYFGSVLCAVDIDQDTLDDLLVGAPFYTTDDKITVKGASGDQGCVFIFRSSRRKEKLCSSVPGSRFGSAISSLGDINYDMLNDFAVGAPYENGGVGKVYIYHGTKNAYNSDSLPNQIIDPSDAYTDLSSFKVYSFGSSLHGGIDIDNNRTPDLVIGSYASKSVFVYRTRPTILLMSQVTFIIDENKATKFKRTDKKFHARLCVRFIISPRQTVVPNLKIWNKFTVDNAHRRFTVSAVEKVNSKIHEATYGHITEFLYEVQNKNQYCIHAEVALNSNYEFKPVIPSNELQIITTFQVWYNETSGIPLDRTTYYIQRSGRNRNTMNNLEVNVQGKGFQSFCSHCPVSKLSEVQSDSLSIENDDCKSDNNPECTSELKFSRESSLRDDNDRIIQPDKNNQYLFTIGSSAFLTLKIDVFNNGETAYNPIIDIKAPNFTGTQFVETGDCKLAENEGDGHKILRCTIGLPLHRKKHVKKEIKIDMSSIYAQNKTQSFPISVAAYPGDSNAVKQAVTKPFHVILMAKAVVALQGNVDIKQISADEKHQETIFTHTFRGSISGLSSIGRVVMIFKIPVNRTKNGISKQMISVVQPTEIMCEPKTGVFSTLKLDGNRKSPSVNTTSTVTLINYPSTKQKRSTESVNAQCQDLKEWQCMEIHCETKLRANKAISVEFLMSINNKIARPLLKDKKELTITSKGIIYILEQNKKEYQKESFSTTTFSMFRQEEFPVWIAFVAGIGGLILLLLITFGLAKCGFFRRKTKEELQKLKRQTRLECDALLGENVPMRNRTEDDE